MITASAMVACHGSVPCLVACRCLPAVQVQGVLHNRLLANPQEELAAASAVLLQSQSLYLRYHTDTCDTDRHTHTHAKVDGPLKLRRGLHKLHR